MNPTVDYSRGSRSGASPAMSNAQLDAMAQTILDTTPVQKNIYASGGNIYSADYKAPVPTVPKKDYAPTYYTDYNDPYALNSLADALLNGAALKKRFGTAGSIPVLAQALGAADVLWSNNIKPIIAGAAYGLDTDGLSGAVTGAFEGLKQSGVNTLINLGETADIVANPIKATAIEGAKALGLGDYGSKYDGDVFRGISSSLGLRDEGRVNYDWDTGNFATDLLLEVISDPTTWTTAGTSSVAKSAAKTQMADAAAKVGKAAVSDATTKRLAKQLSKAYLNSTDDAATVVNKLFNMNTPEQFKSLRKIFKDPTLNKIIGKDFTYDQAVSLKNNLLSSMTDTTLQATKNMRLAKDIRGFTDKAERVLFKAALTSSGIAPAAAGIKKLSKTNIATRFSKKLDAAGELLAKQALFDADMSFNNAVIKQNDGASRAVIDITDKFVKGDKTNSVHQLEDMYRVSLGVKNYYLSEAPDRLTPAFLATVDGLEAAYKKAQLPIDPVSAFVYKHIAPIYKTGFLSTAGFPMRNTIDGIVKNAIERGGLDNVPNAVADFSRATGVQKRYETVLQQLLAFGKNTGYKPRVPTVKNKVRKQVFTDRVTPELITAFYKAHPEAATIFARDEFLWYNILVRDKKSPLSGMTTSVRDILNGGSPYAKTIRYAETLFGNNQELYQEVYDALATRLQKYPDAPMNTILAGVYSQHLDGTTMVHASVAKRILRDMVSFMYVNPNAASAQDFIKYMYAAYPVPKSASVLSKLLDSNPILTVNEDIETALRWSMYLQQRAQGLTHGEAVQKIISTHFVYDNKPTWLKLVETYFPFTGFTIKNFGYWDDLMFNDYSKKFSKDVLANLEFDDYTRMFEFMKRPGVYRQTQDELYYELLNQFRRDFKHVVPDNIAGKNLFSDVRYFAAYHPEGPTLQNFQDYKRSMFKGGGKGLSLAQLVNLMNPISDFDSLTNPELYDYENMERKPFSLEPEHGYLYLPLGMQFQLLNGNIRFGDQYADKSDPKQRKQLQSVLKLNPSWMDALQFTGNPVDSIWGRLIPFLSNALKRQQDASDGQMYRSDLDYILESLPYIGTTIQRYTPVANRMASIGNPLMLEPSILGTVATTPAFNPSNPDPNASEELVKQWYGQYKAGGLQHNPYDYYPQYSKVSAQSQKSLAEQAMNRLYAQYKTWGPEYYENPYKKYPELAAYSKAKATKTPKSVSGSPMYQDLKGLYSSAQYKRPASTYYQQESRINRLARPRNIYKDLYTSTGMSRIQLRLGKQDATTLKYRVSDITYMIRKNWYYIQ